MQTTAPRQDLDTRLPRAVRERSERIRLLQEAQANPDAGNANLGPDGQPIVVPASNDEPQNTNGQAAPAPAAPVTDPREQSVDYWKQRFQVTQGLLNQQRDAIAELRGEMNRRVTELQQQLQQAQQARPAASNDDDIDLSQYYTQEQRDEYGDDQLKTIVRTSLAAARVEAQRAVEAAVAPIRQQEEARSQETALQSKLQFHAAIAQHVPDWEQVDASDPWRAWLREVDENTGLVRNDVLMTNYNNRNLSVVVKMFKEFKAVQPVAPTPPMAPQGAGRAGSTPPMTPEPTPARGAPSAAEIKDFYKRAALGKVGDKERAEFEARVRLS